MQLGFDQLLTGLQRKLASVYLIYGEEPLQMLEAQDAVRAAARSQGFASREVLDADAAGFAWEQLRLAANSMSLFAERRVIELRVPSGKFGKEGGEALCHYVERIPQDTVLLLVSGKLDKAVQSAAWFGALERVGVIVQVWPVKAADLPVWIQRRLVARGLQVSRGGVAVLAERMEGNLLAAAQEIEKLVLLYAQDGVEVELSEREVLDAVSNSSRYNVYDLVEAALQGQVVRSVRILGGLRGEGVAPVLIVWALGTEIRSLRRYAGQVADGQSPASVLAKVWQSRRRPVEMALKRSHLRDWVALVRKSAEVDQIVKGVRPGLVWFELEQLVLGLAGVRLGLSGVQSD